MIRGIPELNRYLDDSQWKTVSAAIRAAGGKVTDGNRLHVDAVLDLMQSRRPWRDLDFRYGQWSAVHAKFVRWFETGILHAIVTALVKAGLTETWRPVYVEISHGPSAVKGPQIRPLMAQIAMELKRHRDAPKKRGRPSAPKLTAPEGTTYRDRKDAYDRKVKAAVKARKGTEKGKIAQADWDILSTRIPDIDKTGDAATRRQVEELVDVMRTNKGWSYMDGKAGKWSVAYARFCKWVADGTMARLVKCLAELGLTKDWNKFLVAPLADREKSLKMIVGAEAWLHEGAGRTRRKPKGNPKATSVERRKTEAKPAKKTATRVKSAKAPKTKDTSRTKTKMDVKVTKKAGVKSAKTATISKSKASKSIAKRTAARPAGKSKAATSKARSAKTVAKAKAMASKTRTSKAA